ncbi:receptor-like protein 43 [Hevea brasiliensis]|uniref:receptor-like protein 43 n=1 Tax=Hevea brasiliensis TaxID=3981 RepID=UPI0025F84530|nr:receptor-like protein 43 [Hevea brasiliensis]
MQDRRQSSSIAPAHFLINIRLIELTNKIILMKPSFCLFIMPTSLFSLLLLCNLIAFTNSFSSSTQPRCHDDERSSLLQFKEGFVIDNSIYGCDPSAPSKIESWKLFHGESSDCCSWDGVECDEETNHVISLDLSSSCLFGSIKSNSSLFHLLQLRRLNLAYNDFNFSQIPAQVGHLLRLTHLNLSSSRFSGEIPDEISNLSSLISLDLSHYNDLRLHKLSLRGLVQNLTHLKVLHLSSVDILSRVPDLLANFLALQSLQLDQCELQGEFPTGIFQLPELKMLDISGNSDLKASLPDFQKGSPLKSMSLSEVKFVGEIPSSIGNLDNLEQLDISQCNFTGLASCNLSEFPTFLHNQDQLQFLDLSSNNIHGQIPSWVWNISTTSMYFMNLSHNFLTGFQQDPYPVVLQWTHLRVLDLRFNMLQGSLSIPPPFNNRSRNECKLAMINLSQNQIQGQVPRSFASCTKLELLDLSNNQFTGRFPSWIGNLPELRILNLRSNGFYGVIEKHKPSNFSKLQIIDLSHNNFTGELPSMYFERWNAMKVADANPTRYIGKNEEFTTTPYYNTYDYSMIINNKGSEMEYLKIPGALAVIDFSHNRFEGDIPEVIGNLKALHLLNLSNNMLRGHIPSSLANLKELECLDLSANKFSGEIPSLLTQLTFLSSFNVAYNQLAGPIPQGNQFDTFEDKSFAGNVGLCGAPLKKKCGDVEASTPHPPSLAKDNGSGSPFEFGWKIVLLGYGSGFVVGGVAGHIFTTRKRGWVVRTFGLRRKQRRRRGQTGNRNRN